ncbi:condensation domain-containing protein, partial [Noviherbaspirillum sp. CPCC 100848]
RRNALGEEEIVAYLVGQDCADPAQLRAQLAACLPAPMIPSRFMSLPALPQTPNGKTDRRALPEPLPEPSQESRTLPREPAGRLELEIARIFSDVLGHAIGPNEDFFLSGGHSLQAIQAMGRLNRELGAAYKLHDLYRAPSAAALSGIAVGRAMPVVRAPEAPDYPLTYAQQALWVLQQMQPGYAGYNVPGSYILQGSLDIDALQMAWAALVKRHESLRTVFRQINGEPRQVILDHMAFSVAKIACADPQTQHRGSVDSPVPADCAHAALPPQVESIIAELTCQPFDLANGPLFRIAVVSLEPGRHVLLLVTHHIISDGWSDAVMVSDLAAAYKDTLARRPASLAAAPEIRYRDFAAWQRRYLASPLAQAHLDYWTGRLANAPLLQVPADRPRSGSLLRPGARIAMRFDAEDAAAWLQAVPASRRYAAITAATLALLHVESGQTDLLLGLPVANRERPELQEQVGLHLNMLPLRLRVEPDAPLDMLRSGCSDAIVEAMAHADYPFARLIEQLGVSALPGRHPLFDAMLIYHQHAIPTPALAGIEVKAHAMRSYTSRFDLDFEIWTDDDGIHGFIEYDAGLFGEERAGQIMQRWQALLLETGRNAATSLKDMRARLLPQSDDTSDFLARSLALDDDF